MSIGKAVWYIENHLGEDLRLDDVSRSSGMSKFHLTRLFGAATGYSVIGYVRARRLTIAARTLSAGGSDILSVALDAGYGSHEAFTRAFRQQFGMTPEQVRDAGDLNQLKLVEPFPMTSSTRIDIQPVRFEDYPATRFAGFSKHFTFAQTSEIPGLWQDFNQHADDMSGAKPSGAWGISYVDVPDENGFDYMAAVELQADADPGSEYTVLPVPALRYAVFAHDRHVSEMSVTMHAAFSWLPDNGFAHSEPGLVLERYTRDFDLATGTGGMEIWLPVRPKS